MFRKCKSGSYRIIPLRDMLCRVAVRTTGIRLRESRMGRVIDRILFQTLGKLHKVRYVPLADWSFHEHNLI